MPEPRSLRAWILLTAVGLVLIGVAGLGGWLAALCGLLAQPVLALAARRQRSPAPLLPAHIRVELWPLLALWALAVGGVGLLTAWPLSSLLASGSLPAALALSAVSGGALIVLWRFWPVWQGLERDGGALGDHQRALEGLEPGAWRGLGIALGVGAVAGLIVALAWPGWLASGQRWIVAVVLAVASAALHGWLQRVAPAKALQYLDDSDEPSLSHEASAQVSGEDNRPADVVGGLEQAVANVTLEPTPVRGGSEPAEVALANVAPVSVPDPQLVPQMYEAARSGRVEHALELIAQGADPHALPPAEDRDQRSLAVLAAVLPDLRLLRTLIAAGVALNHMHAGLTPLLAATRDSWHGRPDAVTTLLANGADPRARDAEGNTPLHFAARSSDPGVAALLRDAAAELDALNDDGFSPLGVACIAGNWRLARFLLERGANPDPDGGQPALLAAAGGEEDDPAGVELLLKLKARVHAVNADGRTALHEGARAGHASIVAALIKAGADPAATDSHGSNALHEAARGGHAAVLEQLLDAADPAAAMAADRQGCSVLMIACMAPQTAPELVQRLLDLGIDPAARDQDGRRAIDRAAETGRWSLVAVFDPAYAVPSQVAGADDATPADRAPITLLREGLDEGREHALDTVAALLGPRQLGALFHDGDGALPPRQIEWLLARGADPEVRDGTGTTPMFNLLGSGPSAQASLTVMLQRGVSPAGAGGLARFLAACMTRGQPEVSLEHLALELLDRGADPFAPSPGGDPALALSVRLGWSQLFTRLVHSGVGLDDRDSRGMSALHLAAALGREAMLKELVAHGAAPGLLAADGQTPLGVALASGRRDLADWLDWRGWPLPRRPLLAADLPSAAMVGDADAVRRLLDLGLPVDAVDSQGCSALLRAAGSGHRAVVDLLLTRGASVGLAAGSGATPLSAAASMRHLDIVDRLIEAGADVEQRLPGGLTVLMIACALGFPELAARLLSAGADADAVDESGRTGLHCAAMFGFGTRDRTRLVTLLDTLMLASDENALEAKSDSPSPLLLLLGAAAEQGAQADEQVLIAGLEHLMDNGASLESQDARGFGPLHLAALHGLLGVVKWLLRAGADPDQRDSLNRSPREIAVMRGFVDIAAQFTSAHPVADVSMARFLREKQ
ncbi:ankyrin repeat domain-containing protein [Lysobacter sp. H21R4]|uniref:ankyrin repeat domain-containing protein n=1 Tax=Lysobacter sp. H21R4 TaxID=2781021 RepID=UPI001888A507|nr:ankyrin repeat domain-containing protein [Lysobacter sp. H21R4]QOY62968.1 ankyrin repeat domain-containing protein [Lysobacter sp. H21R4]